MKGQKRKKKREEKYERGEEEEEEKLNETVKRSKLEKTSQAEEEEEEEEAVVHEMEGIPVTIRDQNQKRPDVIFVLEKASLEVAKVGKVRIHIGIILPAYTLTHLYLHY